MEAQSLVLLKDGLNRYGVTAREVNISAIARHLEMVVEWNERMNLTAILAERDMILKHVIDSATALTSVKLAAGTKLLDVGTGAGFPGVVLKCLEPQAHVVLLESLGKRCTFLEAVGQEVIDQLPEPRGKYEVVWSRAEDAGKDVRFREQFDVVIARAVAELRVLSEYCLPFCRVGGEFLAMKGPTASEELAKAEEAIAKLGGAVAEVREVELPEQAGIRTLIRVKKERATPKAYPRKAGTPAKSPL
ncbi:MAG TPA: 16S rRNA (guanine(527)-N(7))-methyltransferase RsmG [Symbiobacteriaceae bacterium]|nr:16S rRNA (guanine(527)-N(7))-methyltransferase RsmG [Symbiobacteriaceae bacterium]